MHISKNSLFTALSLLKIMLLLSRFWHIYSFFRTLFYFYRLEEKFKSIDLFIYI